MKKLAIFALAAIAGSSQAVLLFDNGNVINNVNGSGQPISSFAPPSSLYGFGCQESSDSWAADDVTATNNWVVQGFTVFSFQAQPSGNLFTFTNIRWSLIQGDVNTGTVVGSGAGAPINQGFVGYRVATTAPNVTTRPIYAMGVTGLNINLTNGSSYWLRWSLDGNAASGNGPNAIPIPGRTTGNGQQRLITGNGLFNTYTDLGNGLNVELPFQLHGIVPEPTTMLALSAGIAAIVARRRRK